MRLLAAGCYEKKAAGCYPPLKPPPPPNTDKISATKRKTGLGGKATLHIIPTSPFQGVRNGYVERNLFLPAARWIHEMALWLKKTQSRTNVRIWVRMLCVSFFPLRPYRIS